MKVIFTRHAQERLERRKILKVEIEHALSFPGKIIKKRELYFYRKRFSRGTIEVVCDRRENLIKVITLYWL